MHIKKIIRKCWIFE